MPLGCPVACARTAKLAAIFHQIVAIMSAFSAIAAEPAASCCTPARAGKPAVAGRLFYFFRKCCPALNRAQRLLRFAYLRRA